MSDNTPLGDDAAPDPIDKAYAQAEAVLSDDEARAARRARVLAAVAREAATPTAAPASSARRPAWRRAGWLAAAGVAGLSVLVATQIYQPPPRQPRNARAAPPSPTPAVRGNAAAPAPVPAPSETPARQALAPAPRTAKPTSPPGAPPAAPPPPPVDSTESARRAFPAAPPPAAVPAPPVAVAADEAADAEDAARSSAPRRSAPVMAAAPAASSPSQVQSSAGLLSDPAARLRAAAAAGRIAEVATLLDQGAPVDAADADGDTALMKSIQADHPAVAALLRRHGASLERRNHAGQSARDMAAAKGDARLNQAIGLGP